MSVFHVPVMVKEVIESLGIVSGKRYIDATVGGGGHGREIIKRGGNLLGIDVDHEAIEHARIELKVQCPELKEGRDWTLVQGNFRDIEQIAKQHGFEQVAGVLFDLGVSSHQLDTPQRGFSYRYKQAPLDLRFDQTQEETAQNLINRLSEKELYEIFTRFGEEELAGAIVRVIAGSRRLKPIVTSGNLVEIIETVVKNQREKNAVLSRVFQALRMVVNDELGALKEGLKGAEKLLAPGGRLAIVDFHSLEDRIVKQFMRRPGWLLIKRKPTRASRKELLQNRRARSAKLRIAEKI